MINVMKILSMNQMRDATSTKDGGIYLQASDNLYWEKNNQNRSATNVCVLVSLQEQNHRALPTQDLHCCAQHPAIVHRTSSHTRLDTFKAEKQARHLSPVPTTIAQVAEKHHISPSWVLAHSALYVVIHFVSFFRHRRGILREAPVGWHPSACSFSASL